MKINYLLVGLIFGISSCDLQKKDSEFIPLVPDNTPFIVGILEATEDTVHHYPEVYVGRVSNPEGFEAELVWTTKGIWWPITNTLVTRPVTRNDFKRVPDENAQVTITGPINDINETVVELSHEGGGVYADINYQLPLIGGKEYKLRVVLSDSRSYNSTTKIPEYFKWEVPESLEVELELGKFYTGVYKEENKEIIHFPFSLSPDVGYLVDKSNSEYDHFNFNMPRGGFLFEDRGNFLREGAGYGLADALEFPNLRETFLLWNGAGDKPLRSSEYWYLSLSQINTPLSNFYYSIFRFLGTNPDGRWDRQDQARLKARVERDTTFFFGISNILKVDGNGKLLPKEQTDAIGVFGAYSAAYRNITVIPKRSWDPDTLNWGNQGN